MKFLHFLLAQAVGCACSQEIVVSLLQRPLASSDSHIRAQPRSLKHWKQPSGTPRAYTYNDLEEVLESSSGVADPLSLEAGSFEYRVGSSTYIAAVKRKYVRFHQYHRGLKVIGGSFTVRMDALDVILSITTENLTSLADVGSAAQHTPEDCLAQFGTDHTLYMAMPLARRPETVIYNVDGSSRVAHMAHVVYQSKDDRAVRDGTLILADETCKVIEFEPSEKGALYRRVYDAQGRCPEFGFMAGQTEFVEGASVPAPSVASVQVYNNFADVFNFYWTMFERDSWDGRGAPLIATVNLADERFPTSPDFMGRVIPSGLSCMIYRNNWANAAWYSGFNQMVYGVGGPSLYNLTALDVTGHEVTHAVTQETSNLVYVNESGALNEAMSDIMGVGIVAWVESGGTSRSKPSVWTTTTDTYVIGRYSTSSGCLRNMSDPALCGQPDYYPEAYRGSADNGGVHINSGIVNLAFYLLAEGGVHPKKKTDVVVPGIGIEKALHIFYLANSALFTPRTDFIGARNHLQDAAEDLFGSDSSEASSTGLSLDAVGISEGAPYCPSWVGQVAGRCDRGVHQGACYNASRAETTQCLFDGDFQAYSCPLNVPNKCRFWVQVRP